MAVDIFTEKWQTSVRLSCRELDGSIAADQQIEARRSDTINSMSALYEHYNKCNRPPIRNWFCGYQGSSSITAVLDRLFSDDYGSTTRNSKRHRRLKTL
jgi:hypothetical protein